MNLNKKWIGIFLICCLLFAVVGCSNDNNNENTGLQIVENNNNESPVVDDGSDAVVETEGALSEAVMAYFESMPDHIYKIGQADFLEKVENGEDMFIIDMRSEADYDKGHIEGAVHLGFNTTMSDALMDIPQDQPVFIYCYSGQTAGQAVATLNVAGIDARSVNLGWNFGISKVEGYEKYVSTEKTEITPLGFDIPGDIKTAVDEFYKGLEGAEAPYKNNIVSEADFKAMMDEDQAYYLLSIRQEKDFQAAHIPGANLLPFGKDMAMGFSDLPKDEKIVVYCYSGQTAGQTVAALRLLGYDAVSLKGGMGVGANAPLGWINNGFIVETPVSINVNQYFAEMPEHIYKIGQADFVEKVTNGDDMFIIDMRSGADYEKGHIEGAVNITFNTMMSDQLMNIPQDKEVFIYCYSGQTAGQAVATLNVAGINARSVNLGWNFGISKVEGVEAITSTEAVEITPLAYDIDPNIQAAMDAYYAGLAEVSDSIYKNYMISEENLKNLIDSEDDSIYILSVRQEDAYKEGHIPGANLLAFGKGMESGFSSLPTDKTIVVYCYSGQTAGQVVAGLRLLGFDAVSLRGGMGVEANAPLGWMNQGYEIVK